VIAAVKGHGPLAPGVSHEQAVDVLWTLIGHEPWLSLVGACGWTPADYQTWLGEALTRLLLPPPGRGPGHTEAPLRLRPSVTHLTHRDGGADGQRAGEFPHRHAQRHLVLRAPVQPRLVQLSDPAVVTGC